MAKASGTILERPKREILGAPHGVGHRAGLSRTPRVDRNPARGFVHWLSGSMCAGRQASPSDHNHTASSFEVAQTLEER